jgi:ferredoxin
MTPNGRVAIDPELCMGSGTCIAVAPDLFDMGDDGIARILQSDVTRDKRLDDAISRCPMGAITWRHG